MDTTPAPASSQRSSLGAQTRRLDLRTRNRGWQVSSPPGLVALWTDGGPWAGTAMACAAPDGECEEVHLELRRISSEVVSVHGDARELVFTAPHGQVEAGPVRKLRVAPFTGVVTATDPEDGEASVLAEQLHDRLDGRLLDALYAVYLRAKRYHHDEPRPEPELDDWEPGYRLAYEALLSGDRHDIYVVEGVEHVALDRHCVTPACNCLDVMVEFIALPQDMAAAPMDVIVPFRRGRRRPWPKPRFETRAEDLSLLRRLWAAYLRRHPDTERLLARRRRVRAVAADRLADRFAPWPAAAKKTPRNAPCPCGSGKKFKRCCSR